jgi:peroxiredoxin/mono/diheme cytochrome c family protein
MRAWIALSALLLGASAAAPALAVTPGDVVENFRLRDADGKWHELYAAADRKAVVVMVQGNGCPIARQALPALAQLREQYRARGVEFLLLNSNLQDDAKSVREEAAEFKINFPILLDDAQLVGEALGVERTAEIFVIDPKGWKLAYHGPLDDRLGYERQRPTAQNEYLRAALDAVLAGQPVAITQVETPGCLVNFPERGRAARHAEISYTQRIAPVLSERCGGCHGKSGSAPELASYEGVRALAPKIRALLRGQSGPTGPADPHGALFEGEQALSAEQRAGVVHWIEAGAQRGSGNELPAVSTR